MSGDRDRAATSLVRRRFSLVDEALLDRRRLEADVVSFVKSIPRRESAEYAERRIGAWMRLQMPLSTHGWTNRLVSYVAQTLLYPTIKGISSQKHTIFSLSTTRSEVNRTSCFPRDAHTDV